ncbi:Wzz/FepE/Etk N-terminal domain-containing protein [uncultured Azohydromonas sp.]|jgi:Capsule polysaccharide export protein|uniref:Wzz/FepE/Etk N-terminal domain-containing protein n=1 Tax=uncultured Azohydromonas sp. TaxID=487342 RepID=UPI0026229376|nr:Wzz/FepE/Etk N-terminal domain-containing protein [uncultured Azohydromonas sp.]
MLADPALDADDEEQGLGLLDLALPLAENLRLLIAGPLLAGLTALGITFIIAPTYTARTTLLPPQQQQSVASSALASLGTLSGLAGLGGGLKSPAEQYVALMQSNTVTDRLIDQFKLMDVYEAKYREDARKHLANNVRINVGKKDGLLTVEVDDTSPQRAAELANAHVEELRRISGGLALSEAQQRRVFFEGQLQQTRDRLTSAQQALQASGITEGVIKSEPKSAAESYARLRAEATATEVRLQALRRSLADNAPEVQQAQATLGALRAQLAQAERSTDAGGANGADYVSKYREFKYQETLFELFARQYEAARVDEAREGALIQVVDPALQPEKKSKPKRALTAVATTLATLLLLASFVIARHFWRRSAAEPQNAEKLTQLRSALRRS